MIRKAIARAWGLYTGRFGAWMKLTFVELLFRLIAAAPLLLLTQKNGWMIGVPAAALLFALLVIPARRHAAEAYKAALDGESPFSAGLLLGPNYGPKLGQGLVTGLKLLLFALPVIGLSLFMKNYYQTVDGFTLLRTVKSLTGNLVRSFALIALVWLLALLPVFFGVARFSCDRHALAQTGSRAVLKGKHTQVILAWLAALITCLPFVLVSAGLLAEYAVKLIAAVKELQKTMKLTMPVLGYRIWGIAAAYVVLRLPLLPFKGLIGAALTDELTREAGEKA